MKTSNTNTTLNKLIEHSPLPESNELLGRLIKSQAADLRRAAKELNEAATAIWLEDYASAVGSYREHRKLLANYRGLADATLTTLDGLDLLLSPLV